MPKIKTVRGATKHFKKIDRGGFKYKHANPRHILTEKTIKRKCRPCLKAMVPRGDPSLIIVCPPYV